MSARAGVMRDGFFGLFSLRSIAVSLPDFPVTTSEIRSPSIRSMPDGH